MAQKTHYEGRVLVVSQERNSFKVGDKWYRISDQSRTKPALPEVGDTVSFDAYGTDQNIVYRFNSGGESNNGNGAGSSVLPGVAVSNGTRPDPPASGPATVTKPVRAHALQAAATLLQGSEGNVEQVAQNVIVVAGVFEEWLRGRTATEELL